MRTIRNIPYTHFFLDLPTIYSISANQISTHIWRFRFTEDSKYDFPKDQEVDERDWSKAVGLSFSPILHSRKKSVMMGWRYNDDTDSFDTCIYVHGPKGEVDKSKVILDIPANTDIIFKVEVNTLKNILDISIHTADNKFVSTKIYTDIILKPSKNYYRKISA